MPLSENKALEGSLPSKLDGLQSSSEMHRASSAQATYHSSVAAVLLRYDVAPASSSSAPLLAQRACAEWSARISQHLFSILKTFITAGVDVHQDHLHSCIHRFCIIFRQLLLQRGFQPFKEACRQAGSSCVSFFSVSSSSRSFDRRRSLHRSLAHRRFRGCCLQRLLWHFHAETPQQRTGFLEGSNHLHSCKALTFVRSFQPLRLVINDAPAPT
mmetsp:Transcript_90007/g.165202  ORF Transcript_90007/g.165202 Transcript_90007/m.165202 type:complete len:214 (+) Transcript_90007:2-643(+)